MVMLMMLGIGNALRSLVQFGYNISLILRSHGHYHMKRQADH